MKFFTNLINKAFNKKVYDYVQNRDKFYKIKITSSPENAVITMNEEEKYFGAYKNGEVINYQVSMEGYQTKDGSITVDNRDISKQVVTIVKYADFYKEGDVPTIENRDLSDDNLAGMFMITMKEGASNATYTLNRAKMSSIMEDVAVISDYVEGLQHVPNVTAIEIVEEGTLSKHGNVWKVNKKMKVKIGEYKIFDKYLKK